MEVALFAGLVIGVYLIVLNGFLNGLFKARIDTILSCLVLGVIAIVFLLSAGGVDLPALRCVL
jgi:hypothetical protein